MNEENKDRDVPYYVLEGVMTHDVLILKRVLIILALALLLCAGTIFGFLWYISLPVEETSSVNVENTGGNANYIGNDMNGDFNYGESEGNSK